ncbi:alpha/beta fold hydrolase [Paraburkholderia silviterrae]|uniref:Alpha/beta hydrolase family protein DUF900 n=1 Tax=Paraburkholderia silviterrae TaxID=2528715 RepID=A0A4R5M5D1_9BURK|nr:hypothetical protein [Paraburkholderia silviterrae]TDG20626.1 hypothetical protein EYW47_26020 [Paraburkholderia silviterrae]
MKFPVYRLALALPRRYTLRPGRPPSDRREKRLLTSITERGMSTQPAGPCELPGVDLESWLIEFDKNGACTSPKTREALLNRIAGEGDLPVILFSHGWNNEFGDATRWYAAFVQHLQTRLHEIPDRKHPLFVGVIWPSTWLSFDTGPEMAAGGETPASAGDDEALTQDLLAQVEDPAQREKLTSLLGEERLSEADATTLAELIAATCARASADSGVEGAEGDPPDAQSVLEAMKSLQALAPDSTENEESLEPGVVTGHTQAPLRDAGGLRYLDPRWALRVASVYQMKNRAGKVGANGVFELVKAILNLPATRLHLVGHSYGAKVVLSSIVAAPLPRPVESVLLLQPAISYLAFAAEVPGKGRSGGYREALKLSRQPVLTTYSAHDFPLHEVFHRALRRDIDPGEPAVAGGEMGVDTLAGPPPNQFAALGGYGPRGASERLIEPLPDPGEPLDIDNAVAIVGFDGTMQKRVAGHGDIATPYTAWLLHLQLSR